MVKCFLPFMFYAYTYLRDSRHWTLIILTLLMNLFIVVLFAAPDELTRCNITTQHYILKTCIHVCNFSQCSLILWQWLTMTYSNTNSSNNSSQLLIFVFPPVVPDWYRNYAQYLFGSLHVLFSTWMVVEYFVLTWPDIRFRLASLLL